MIKHVYSVYAIFASNHFFQLIYEFFENHSKELEGLDDEQRGCHYAISLFVMLPFSRISGVFIVFSLCEIFKCQRF